VRIVLDTNVLVSGLLGVYTYPARMMDMVVLGRLKCVYDDRIMMEYREVLSRPKFRQVISDRERGDILGYLAHSGIHVVAAPLGREVQAAPDPADVPFVEVAVAGGADLIVTGNTQHFSFFADNERGIRVVSPRQCYNLICQAME
jgi:putative PIN family toxin of toxin-antitoxin system